MQFIHIGARFEPNGLARPVLWSPHTRRIFCARCGTEEAVDIQRQVGNLNSAINAIKDLSRKFPETYATTRS